MINFSWYRLWAIITKEFIQIRRDRPTLAMMIGIPLLQLTLFGYAINTNPRDLPTIVMTSDYSPVTRDLLSAMQNTAYFRFITTPVNEKQARAMLEQGEVIFAITIPPNFGRDYVRGLNPAVLLEADATDPVSTGSAIAALNVLANRPLHSYARAQEDPVADPKKPSFDLRVHALYNPLAITQYNIVPGLLGVVLTMTMAFITSIGMTRERERGTLENLLATPVYPIEVIIGKITPYIIIGYIQVILILLVAYFVFAVPMAGSIFLLFLACLPFIAANLSVGLTFSTLAKNQLQAVQGAMFFFLPSLLLSGFLFPFFGMPKWAQWLGSLLPLTHFVRITRGILLKGNGFLEIWPQLWPIILFTIVLVLIGVKYFRRTLD